MAALTPLINRKTLQQRKLNLSLQSDASSRPQHHPLFADAHNLVATLLGIQRLTRLKVVKKTVVRNSSPRPTVAIETGHMYSAPVPHPTPPQIPRHTVIFYWQHRSSAAGKNRTVSGRPFFIENSRGLQQIASTTILPGLSLFFRHLNTICISQWKIFLTSMRMTFASPPTPPPHHPLESVFTHLEQPKNAERGTTIKPPRFRVETVAGKKSSWGEEWLQRDRRERCAKLIRRCQLLLRGVTLCVQSHIMVVSCTVYYEPHKQKKPYKCLILRCGKKGMLWKIRLLLSRLCCWLCLLRLCVNYNRWHKQTLCTLFTICFRCCFMSVLFWSITRLFHYIIYRLQKCQQAVKIH